MSDFFSATSYKKLFDLPDKCPNHGECNGWLVIIGNEQNKFIGCSSYTESANMRCKNSVKIAKLVGLCRACELPITVKMLIAKHRRSAEWVHLGCIDMRMKTHRICLLCHTLVHDGEEAPGHLGGSRMGLRHTWCARSAAAEYIAYPAPIVVSILPPADLLPVVNDPPVDDIAVGAAAVVTIAAAAAPVAAIAAIELSDEHPSTPVKASRGMKFPLSALLALDEESSPTGVADGPDGAPSTSNKKNRTKK